MTAKKVSYETINYVASFLVRYKAQKQQEDPSKKVKLQEVEQELADYCSLSRNSIISIKRNDRQPSLAVAILMARFFNVSVEDICELKIVEESNENESPKGEDSNE